MAVAALALALVLGAVARGMLLPGPPAAIPVPAAATTAGPQERDAAEGAAGAPGLPAVATSGSSSTSPSGSLVVHVVGVVARPGLVRLPTGARVADAVAAAGGAGPDADLARLNLARPVTDGEQVVVPRPGEPVPSAPAPQAPPAAKGGGAGAAAPGGALVDLNQASAQELDGLPGIGEVLAGRIVEWREQHGAFRQVEELGEVAGIGERLLERLRPLVTV